MSLAVLTALFVILILWFVIADMNYAININSFKLIWGVISVLAAILALLFEPNPNLNFDLNRIFDLMDNMSMFGMEETVRYTDLDSLFIAKYWYYIVATLLPNGIVTAVPFFIDFIIIGYILTDLAQKIFGKELSSRKMLIAFFFWGSLIGLKLAITDIRCVLAMSLCCFALYNEYIIGNKGFCYYSLYIISFLIHHFVVLFMVVRGLLFIKNKFNFSFKSSLFYFMLFIGTSALFYLINNNFENIYLYNISYKLNSSIDKYSFTSYLFEREWSMKILNLSFIMLMFLGFAHASTVYKNISFKMENSYLLRGNDFLYATALIGIVFCWNYLILERLMYIAAFAFSINYLLICNDIKNAFNMIIYIPLLAYILYFNDINAFIVNYLGYAFLRI